MQKSKADQYTIPVCNYFGKNQLNKARRFGGIGRLYGDSALERFESAHLCVVGVGGVGSWAVEALARSGIGRLTLIDMDHVAESNINRQLPALESELGKAKVQALAERIQLINSDCEVTCIEEFVDQKNLSQLIHGDFDWVIDCIDSFRIKAAMIAHSRRRKQAVITVGGAGGQVDATRVRVSDLYKTEQDPLLARTRRLLRQEYGFSSNPKRRFRVPCVWSDEPQRTSQGCMAQEEGSLNCAGFGACMPVTAGFGMAVAGYVLRNLSESGCG